MVQYKLTYFEARGAAEVIRQIFALAGAEYEDVRIPRDEWPKHKAEMPFGQMPVLEVDGQQLAQSFAIARFLAKKFGLTPKCPFEEAQVDSLMDQFKDFQNEVRPAFMVMLGFAEGDKDKLIKEVLLPGRDKFFGFMTKFLKKNNTGYLVGSSITIPDLLLAEFSSEMSKKVPNLLEGYPEIKAHAEKVRSNPALKKWIETRPETPF
ncbi:unnamed protein product [Cylicocyclus nassatus]|uniref:glutathione transferase n=1 Tax=Cylicocyclus nassatus TaxID=53992 RepID=A0AA36MAS2_CYLNA|nr:unnamed protein product [Cylicocyclus nassatus]